MKRYLTLNRAHKLFNEAFNLSHPYNYGYPTTTFYAARQHQPRRPLNNTIKND